MYLDLHISPLVCHLYHTKLSKPFLFLFCEISLSIPISVYEVYYRDTPFPVVSQQPVKPVI